MNLDAGDSYYVAHNPTRGAFADLWESLRDKIGWTTPAAQEIANLLTSASDAGRKISIVAHSQGGAMVTEGIRVAAAAYGKHLQGISVSYHSGANNQAATNRILDKAGVQLFGGLQATGYRSAPNDLVPQIVGFNWAPDPFKFFRSIFDSHLLLKSGTTPANTLSPHTFPYKPNEGLNPKIDLPKPGGD
jgi:hypothetical protein